MTLRMNSVVDFLILESQCCSRKRCESGNLRDLSDSEVHPIRKCASGLVGGRLNRRNSSSGTVLIEVLRTEAEELLKDRHLSRNCTASANGTPRGRKNLEQKVVCRQKHRNSRAPGIAHLHCRHVVPLTQQLHISRNTISRITRVCWNWLLCLCIVVEMNLGEEYAVAALSSQKSNLGLECEDVIHYYDGASGLKGDELKTKLHEIIAGHRSLSYFQVWNALKVLDSDDFEFPEATSNVVEIYSLKQVPKDLAGSVEGWNREHLWPRSYGLMEGRPEFTDLHNLRPADANVNSSRGNKYFGNCALQESKFCLVPANREAASDTATDSNTWRPPAEVRGDIARALLYMAVRYGSDQPPGSLTLQLSDSPSVENARMGLLSILLQWHHVDPPSTSELLRNARVCSLYQRNRNPFVDHPEFVASIWGSPTPVAEFRPLNVTSDTTTIRKPPHRRKAGISIVQNNKGKDLQ